MKNIAAAELELNGKPSSYCNNNGTHFFHGDRVSVMGRADLDEIPEIISKEAEYLVNPSALQTIKPKLPGLGTKASISGECQCYKKVSAVQTNNIYTNNFSTTSLPSYIASWQDTYQRVCGKGNEISSTFWNSTGTSSDSAAKGCNLAGLQFEKPCMSNGCDGAEAGRMVRSASLGFDPCSKFDLLGIRSDDLCSVSTAEAESKCTCGNAKVKDFSRNSCHPNASPTRRASVPSYGGDPAAGRDMAPQSLSAVLERIPLAYYPQTKKLHIISVNSVPNPSPAESHTGKKGPATAAAACSYLENDRGSNYVNESQETDSMTEDEDLTESCAFSNSKGACCPLLNTKLDSCPGAAGNHEEYSRTCLQRVSTSGSLPSRAECSSFSSISSLSTEFSMSAASAFEDIASEGGGKCGSLFDSDEAGFIEINLDLSARSSVKEATQNGPLTDEQCGATQGAKPKRRGLSGFLSRNLLSWKSSREGSFPGNGEPGWNFFTRGPPVKDPNKVIEDYHARQEENQANSNPSEDGCSTPRSRRSEDLVASSTTALILENRPSNLPAKAPEEEIKHRLQYTQMVEAAKKKELKEAKLKKKLLQQQLRHEEQLSLASKIWNTEILPCWDTMKQSRKAKDLWWQGIPPSVRGKVWKLAIGNDLHITPELYEICVCRAKDRIRMAAECISVSEDDAEDSDKEGSVELIKLDVSRTFPQLCIFQKGGPYYDMLHSLLGAYVCYRPDVGYVQGMSFLAAVLILNLEVADAFICFANLLNQPCQLAFFRLDEPMMRSYFLTYEEFFKENMPKLFNHFTRQLLSPDLYLIDWIYTLYSRSLPLDVASRVWDVFFRDGDEFLFRTALGILRLYEDILLNLDFIHLAQFLTKLPEDIAAGPLFKSIECIRMVAEKHSFSQVLLSHAELKQT